MEVISAGHLFVFRHQFGKIVEQVVGVVGTRGGFGMVLDAEDGFPPMPESLQRLIV